VTAEKVPNAKNAKRNEAKLTRTHPERNLCRMMTSKLGVNRLSCFEENGLQNECSAERPLQQEGGLFRTIVSDAANRL
jgi:hypothetical protein